jgi:hypothetical protein
MLLQDDPVTCYFVRMLELRKRFRISLLGALTIVTVVALAISHFYTSLRAARLQRELTLMRRTFGYPDVTSHDRISSGMVRMHVPRLWSFRVFKPAGQSLVVRCVTKGIGHYWLPTHEHEVAVPIPRDQEGELFVNVELSQGEDGYQMTIRCEADSVSRSVEIPLPPEHPLVAFHFPEARSAATSVGESYGFRYWTPTPNLHRWKTAKGDEPHLLFAYAHGLTGESGPGSSGEIYYGAGVWLEAVDE